MTKPLLEGLDLEARIVGELMPGRTAKNLIWLFQTQTALKSDREGGLDVAPRKIKRIAVLGAGIMGGGIAQLAANNNIPVRLRDIDYDAILTALRTANDIWQRRVKRKRMTRREHGQKMAFISSTLSHTGFKHVDLVIEAVVENLEVKRKVLAEIERHISDRAVFATNTSSLPISEIAARALRPERVVGMHFFNPVHRMPLVEVIAGRQSSPESVATVHALAVAMGKVPVLVKDGPGFLVNRILSFYMSEAIRLLVEGVRIEALDSAMTVFGMPMGPFALLDTVGLDTAHHVGEVMRAALGKARRQRRRITATGVGRGGPAGSEEHAWVLPLQGRQSEPCPMARSTHCWARRNRARSHRRRCRNAWYSRWSTRRRSVWRTVWSAIRATSMWRWSWARVFRRSGEACCGTRIRWGSRS